MMLLVSMFVARSIAGLSNVGGGAWPDNYFF
jgi:hypothetical protein